MPLENPPTFSLPTPNPEESIRESSLPGKIRKWAGANQGEDAAFPSSQELRTLGLPSGFRSSRAKYRAVLWQKSPIHNITLVISHVIVLGEPILLRCKRICLPGNGLRCPSAGSFPPVDVRRVECFAGYRLQTDWRSRWLYGFLDKAQNL